MKQSPALQKACSDSSPIQNIQRFYKSTYKICHISNTVGCVYEQYHQDRRRKHNVLRNVFHFYQDIRGHIPEDNDIRIKSVL